MVAPYLEPSFVQRLQCSKHPLQSRIVRPHQRIDAFRCFPGHCPTPAEHTDPQLATPGATKPATTILQSHLIAFTRPLQPHFINLPTIYGYDWRTRGIFSLSDVRIVDLSSARVCEKKSRDICANAEVSQFGFSGVNHLPTEMLTPDVEEKISNPIMC